MVAERLSIVVPALNEAARIRGCLEALAPLRGRGHQVIVADGGSSDATRALAAGHCDLVLEAPRGRASQMNAGARAASGDALLFLHADTRLPPGGDELIFSSLKSHAWGRFDVRIEGAHPLLPLVAAAMNLRSRLTGIATGDQAIFVTRSLFTAAGDYPDIALMEDIALSARLKRFGPPLCLKHRTTTSGRRWEKHGVLRTIVLMWRLRLAYWLGTDPAKLAPRYDRS